MARQQVQIEAPQGVAILEYAGNNKYAIVQNVPNSNLVVKARKGEVVHAAGADAAWLIAHGWRLQEQPKQPKTMQPSTAPTKPEDAK